MVVVVEKKDVEDDVVDVALSMWLQVDYSPAGTVSEVKG